MRTALNALLVLTAFAATFQAGSWYRQRAVASALEPRAQALVYICPMHPGYTSDRPGDAPCCGMRLEPASARDQRAPAGADLPLPADAVSLTAWQQQLIGVRVEVVEGAAGSHTLRLPGRVAPDERLVHSLNAGLEGTIRDVSGATTGSRVRKHQVLATYTAPDFLLAVQSYVIALDGLDRLQAGRARDAADRRAADGGTNEPEAGPAAPRSAGPLPPIISRGEAGLVVNSGSSNFQQRIDRLHLLGMSDLQIEEIRRMRDIPQHIKIVAPADGTVLARNVTPGWKFMRGEEWFRIADLRRVWVFADVPVSEAEHVRAGQAVRVKLPQQGKTFAARLSDIAPQFDVERRSLQLRLEVDNPREVLRPGMFVDVELPIASAPTISVPVDAVIDTGLRKTVYVEHAPGVFEPRAVETGWRRGERVEILHGLSRGNRIVTAGTFLLDSESRMRGAVVRTADAPAATGKDPVCGMDVDVPDARAAGRLTERGGATTYFCSMPCKQQFDRAAAPAGETRHHVGG